MIESVSRNRIRKLIVLLVVGWTLTIELDMSDSVLAPNRMFWQVYDLCQVMPPVHSAEFLLIILLFYRYGRLLIAIIANLYLYEPDRIPDDPKYQTRDAHVVISTIDPNNVAFQKCVQSVLENNPGHLTISTGGEKYVPDVVKILEKIMAFDSGTQIDIRTIVQAPANKRQQMRLVMDDLARQPRRNSDKLVVFVDDHAWWPGTNFLNLLIAPFEDPKVGLVGVRKEVQRDKGRTFLDGFINFLACIYLERHNFEITAQNAIDGGAFVISARTCAVRAKIIMEQDFREGFTDEKLFFGLLGPLAPDDDNYITRYVTAQGHKIKFQNHPDCTMWTTLGDYPSDGTPPYKKFHGQLMRWARSQWRSNVRSVFQPVVWQQYWRWSVPIQFIGTCFNLAAFWDTIYIYLWSRTNMPAFTIIFLLALIFGSKLVKLTAYFLRHPGDLKLFPGYVVFAYYHSFIKFWSCLTWWDLAWSGRRSGAEQNEPNEYESIRQLIQPGLTAHFVASGSPSMPDSCHLRRHESTNRRPSSFTFATGQSVDGVPGMSLSPLATDFARRRSNSQPSVSDWRSTHYVCPMPPPPDPSELASLSRSLRSANETIMLRNSPLRAAALQRPDMTRGPWVDHFNGQPFRRRHDY